MNFIIDKKKFELNLMILFVIICFFSGILTYSSYMIENEYLKIWKEIYILLLGLFTCIFNFKFSRIKINYNFFFLFIILIFFLIEIIYSYLLGIAPVIIIYQLKNDLLLFLFAIYISIFFISLNKDEIRVFSIKIIKIIIFLGIINAIAMILQYVFFEQFINLIGLEMGNWGTKVGLKITTVGESLRPIGFQFGFVQAATLVYISFIIMNENKFYKIKYKFIKYLFNIIFITAIILSTYATSIIGAIIYIVIKSINKLFKLNLFIIPSIMIFLLFIYTTHCFDIYDIVSKISPSKAYTSIFLRVEQHLQIINDVSQNLSSIFGGIGLGVNGLFGLDKELYGIVALATDSTYIYILSNYGFIGVIIYVFILFYYMLVFYKNDLLGIKYCLFYILIVDFFFNNTIVNFPVNFLIILLVCMSIRLKDLNIISGK